MSAVVSATARMPVLLSAVTSFDLFAIPLRQSEVSSDAMRLFISLSLICFQDVARPATFIDRCLKRFWMPVSPWNFVVECRLSYQKLQGLWTGSSLRSTAQLLGRVVNLQWNMPSCSSDFQSTSTFYLASTFQEGNITKRLVFQVVMITRRDTAHCGVSRWRLVLR